MIFIRIQRGSGIYKLPAKYANIPKFIIPFIEKLTEFSKDCGEDYKNCALRLLFNLFNNNPNFDIGMVQLLKIMIANYLTINSKQPINGIEPATIVLVHNMSLDEFIYKEILEPYTNAKSIILIVAPLVLLININILVLDIGNKDIVQFLLSYRKNSIPMNTNQKLRKPSIIKMNLASMMIL